MKLSRPFSSGSGNSIVDRAAEIDLRDESEMDCCYDCGDEFPDDDLIPGTAVGLRHHKFCESCVEEHHIEYRCNVCTDELMSNGIPTTCSRCGSWNIEHALAAVNILIKKKQEAELAKMEAEPLQTPNMIATMRMEDEFQKQMDAHDQRKEMQQPTPASLREEFVPPVLMPKEEVN